MAIKFDSSGGLTVTQEAAYSIAGLGALANPVLDPPVIELHNCWFLGRIVGPDNLYEPAVPRMSLLDHDDPIERVLLLSKAR
jgi:hypothetical protein